MRISLIGTYHEELGAATVAALLEILERIQPEVVFAEIPRTHIDAWRDGSHGTLESIAVARYADTHLVDVVPVDLPKPEESFFRDYEELCRAIARTSDPYHRLMDRNTERMRLYGFSYLNSEECIQAWTDIVREELETVEYTRSARLHEIYGRVRDLMERRDMEMLKNIRDYCASADRTYGTFLVGAAHRKSLIEKIRASEESATPRIEWDLLARWGVGDLP